MNPVWFSRARPERKLLKQLILNYTELRNFRLRSFQRTLELRRRSFCPPRDPPLRVSLMLSVSEGDLPRDE